MIHIPTNASSSSLIAITSNSLTEANQKTVEAIQKSINVISSLYKTLPEKLERLNRVPGLSSMRKDLDAQRWMLAVNVEAGFGSLISSVEETLKRSQLAPHLYHSGSPASPSVQGLEDILVVGGIKTRLDNIHTFLKSVDSLSDALATEHDKKSLPIRQRKDANKLNLKHGQSQSTKVDRGGVTKKPLRNLNKKPKNHDRPGALLGPVITTLTKQLEEFSRECQKLQPAARDDTFESSPIPEDLELAKKAAIMLCKALCQACPNKNHIHSVLFGLSTQELWLDDGNNDNNTRDAGVEFNMAFESPGEPETWFVVQSTMKASQDGEEMDLVQDDFDDDPATVEPAARAAGPSSFSSRQHRGFSYTASSAAEPNAHFCLQYHKQGTSDLAAALKHSDICEHELFYPDQTRLDFLRDSERTIPLRQLLADRNFTLQQLPQRQKVRIARLLAEAVLKFHAADWLGVFGEWDWDDVLIYEIDGTYEPHLRLKLRSPGAAGKRTGKKSPLQEVPALPDSALSPREPVGDVVSQLGKILGNIAVGSFPEPTYAAVWETSGSNIYAEVFKACVDMSKMSPDLSDLDVREEFYTKVVAKLDSLEQDFSEDEEDMQSW